MFNSISFSIMKTRSRILSAILPVLVLVAACSDDSGTNPDPNNTNRSDTLLYKDTVATRAYDKNRGGLQITAIYFNQGWNDSAYDLEDEWIVLESDAPISTSGWKLNAGDPLQNYPLPATINNRLTIYTRKDSAENTGSIKGLELNAWIWNNTEPDTARIYDAAGKLVHSVTYNAK
jgi:hypothetical protein